MAKKKKKSLTVASRGFGKKNLTGELNKAEACLAREQWGKAHKILSELGKQYPNEKKIWTWLSAVCFELEDMQGYQRACEHWVELEPNNGEVLLSLGFAYLRNFHPLLALTMFRRALETPLNSEQIADINKQIPLLEKFAEEAKANFTPDTEDWWELALRHEQGQAYLEEGEYEKAREAEQKVLDSQPNFVPARNNLSLIYWMAENPDSAIATAKSVLETESNNIHALSNLVRFFAQLGDDVAAQPYAARLKTDENPNSWNSWTKKIEGLSFLGDDEGIVEVYEQWQKEGTQVEKTDPYFNHLVAVALARCDRLEGAKKHWDIALSTPSSKRAIAQQNRHDLRRPVGQRHGAWPFSLTEWFPPKTVKAFRQIFSSLNQGHNARKLESTLKTFFDQHPIFLKRLPRILERGGPEGQTFLVSVAEHMHHPELIAAIKDFALGQNGTDQLRTQAAMHAVKAGVLGKENVRMWQGGQWREIMLMAYEIYNEPEKSKHSKKVASWLEQSVLLLREQSKAAAQEAEELLQKAIAAEPEAPDVMFNLAAAQLYLGRELEAKALIHQVHERFPDYLFARTTLAKFHTQNRDFEAAEALLAPLRKLDRFHATEFDALMDAQIELEVAKKNYQGAQTWIDMWAGAAPHHPQIARWESRIQQI